MLKSIFTKHAGGCVTDLFCVSIGSKRERDSDPLPGDESVKMEVATNDLGRLIGKYRNPFVSV